MTQQSALRPGGGEMTDVKRTWTEKRGRARVGSVAAALNGLVCAAMLAASATGAPCHAQSSPKIGGTPAATKGAGPVVPRQETPPEQGRGTLAEQYCRAIRDAAAEARQAHLAAELKGLGKDLDERLAKVVARTAELKDWIQQRDAFVGRATSQLVAIYAAMRPESASEQLARIDEFTAAAVLGKLDPRAASAILNDMPAEKAGRLATILAGASRTKDRGDKS